MKLVDRLSTIIDVSRILYRIAERDLPANWTFSTEHRQMLYRKWGRRQLTIDDIKWAIVFYCPHLLDNRRNGVVIRRNVVKALTESKLVRFNRELWEYSFTYESGKINI